MVYAVKGSAEIKLPFNGLIVIIISIKEDNDG